MEWWGSNMDLIKNNLELCNTCIDSLFLSRKFPDETLVYLRKLWKLSVCLPLSRKNKNVLTFG